jgi:hypothetical protein
VHARELQASSCFTRHGIGCCFTLPAIIHWSACNSIRREPYRDHDDVKVDLPVYMMRPARALHPAP